MMINREHVLDIHNRRLAAREVLMSDTGTAKSQLSPRALWRRWSRKQVSAAQNVADEAIYGVRKNAGLLGAIGAGVLLIAARKPIIKILRQFLFKQQVKHTPSTFNEQDIS
jgi:hypothetical protein